MGLRCTSHAVYDAGYHLVWAPKYRKLILRGDIRQRVKELFGEIAAHHGIEIAAMEWLKITFIWFVISFPPRYSISIGWWGCLRVSQRVFCSGSFLG